MRGGGPSTLSLHTARCRLRANHLPLLLSAVRAGGLSDSMAPIAALRRGFYFVTVAATALDL